MCDENLTAVEKGAELYSHPVVRTIAQLFSLPVPFLGLAADSFFPDVHDRLVKERQEQLVRYLGRLSCDFTEEQIRKSDKLCDAILTTVQAASRARHREKIRFIAAMLSNYNSINTSSEDDNFEELMRILDDMSYREVQVIVLFGAYTRQRNEAGMTDEEGAILWSQFIARLADLGIPEQERVGFFQRLARTGFCRFLGGAVLRGDGEAVITPNFARFLSAIEEHPMT